MEKDYFSIPEAARFCAVSRTTMWRWVKEGYVKSCTTLGGQHRIRKADLDAALNENQAYRVPPADVKSKPAAPDSVPDVRKILIVDDDPQILNLMVRILATKGYPISTASDGFEAGIQVMDFNPDLIILDLIMPGMDGFEVCRRIKDDPRTADTRVLAVTGFDTDENRERIMDAGADGYLTKPVEKAELLRVVEELLEASRKLSAAVRV